MTTIRSAFRGERSHTLILMKLLANGQPWTPPQLAEASGLTLQQVYNSMRNLRKGAFMRSLPQPYQITPTGLECLAERLSRAEEFAYRSKKYASEQEDEVADAVVEDADEPFEHRLTSAPANRDEVVDLAVNRRHPIAAVWSAMP